MNKVKKQRRSLKPLAPPAAIPPEIMSRARVRPLKPSREKETAKIAPNPLTEAAWDRCVAELSVILLQPDIWEDEPEEKLDPEVEKAREEEDTARARMWDGVVAMAIDAMREPERRTWLHEQRVEEEQQRVQAMRRAQETEPVCADWSGPAQYVEF